MTSAEVANLLVAAAGFMVALASLAVSWLAYSRDAGRLDVSVGLGHIWGGRPLQAEQRVIFVKIVNSGRRPIVLSSLGGDLKFYWLRRLCGLVLSDRPFARTSFLFMDSPLINAQLMPQGVSRVLQEGESLSVTLPFQDYRDLAATIAGKAGSIYVFDSLSKKHRMPCRGMRKFRTDWKDWEAGSETT